MTDRNGTSVPASRREFLRYAAAGAGAAALGLGAEPFSARALAKSGLTFFVWAGVWSDVVKQQAIAPFAKSFPSVSVDLEVGTNAQAYPKMVANKSNPLIVGGMFNDIFAQRGLIDNVWRPFDKKLVSNSAAVVPSLNPAGGMGIALSAYPFAIAYNPKVIAKPTSWTDLWRPAYKGRVAIQDGFYDAFVMAAKVTGHDPNDVEAGIKAWQPYKGNIGVWTSGPSQTEDLIDRGEIYLAPHWGPWALAAQALGKTIDFVIPKEGATQQTAIMQLAVGFNDQDTEMAQRFMNLWLTPAYQKVAMGRGFFGPSIKGVEVPPALKGKVPTAEEAEKLLLRYDYRRMAENLTAYKSMVDQMLK